MTLTKDREREKGMDEDEGQHTDVCFQIENDPFYKTYLHDLHDHQDHHNKITVPEKIDKLNLGIEALARELEAQVLARHPDLLAQASNTSSLDDLIGKMQLDGQTLIATLEKIRSQVLVPADILETQIDILARVQQVVFLLRHASEIIALCRQLEKAEGDLSAQANVLYEVELYLSDYDFEGIDPLAEELALVRRTKENIVTRASRQLRDGLAAGDKAPLLSALKIFDNLKCARERVDEVIDDLLKEARSDMRRAFDVRADPDGKKPNEPSRSGPGKANAINTRVFDRIFWENTERLFGESLFACCRKVVLLQSALDELNAFENYNFVAKTCWNGLSAAFAAELKKSSIASNRCAEIDFPRLLKLYTDLIAKLRRRDFSVPRSTLAPWENSFLSISLERLLEPVRTMWDSDGSPTAERIDSCVRAISSALGASSGDRRLGEALAASVAKCSKQMIAEAEQRVRLDDDAGQIIGAPSTSQRRNAELSNALHYFSSRVRRVLDNMSSILSAESVEIIKNGLRGVANVGVLQPLRSSMSDAIESIVGAVHDEANPIEDGKIETPSPYLRELERFVSRCAEIYLSLYRDADAVKRCSEEIASRCIDVFVVNVCCLRPVSPARRRKLRFDCEYLETALRPLTSDPSPLDSHRRLKALHALLGLTPDGIADSQSKGGALPYSFVMLLLFSFGGEELVSPGACVGWGHRRTIAWLTGPSSERERLEFVAGALQKYQAYVRQNNIDKYDEVYPILLQLLEDGKKYAQGSSG